MQDEFALPELSLEEKKMYGNFWARYKSTSSLSLGSVDEERDAASVPSPVTSEIVQPSPASTTLATADVVNVVAPAPTTGAAVAPEVALVAARAPTTGAAVGSEVAHVAAPTAAAVAPEVAQVLAPAPTTGAAAVAPVEVGHVVAPAATAVAKGPPSVPPKMELPAVPARAATEDPGQPSTTTRAAPMTNEALTTMLAAVLSQSMAGGADAAHIGAIQQSLAAIVAKATGGAAAQPLQQQRQEAADVGSPADVATSQPQHVAGAVDKTKIIETSGGPDLQPALPSTPSPAASPATPNPPGTPKSPPPCTTLALAKAPGAAAVINSGTHKTEYKTFQRFCENSPGAEELKKVWVQGGPQRLAMFQKFVLTGCD